MTPERMEQIGRRTSALSYTDEELREQLTAVQLVAAYLRGRGDCGVMVSALRREEDMLTGFQEARHRA